MLYKRLVFGVGVVLVALGLLWGRSGFTADQTPWLVGLLAVGGLIMWLARKLPATGGTTVPAVGRPAATAPRGSIDDRIAATQFMVRTTKDFGQVVELGRQAARTAAGVATTVHEVEVSPDGHVIYKVKCLGAVTVLTFGVSVVEGDGPGENLVALTVAGYVTSRATLLFIGVGPEDAAGYPPLRTFSETLRALLDDGAAPAAEATAPTALVAAPAAVASPASGSRSRVPVGVLVGGAVLVAAVGTVLFLVLGRDDEPAPAAVAGDTPTAAAPSTSGYSGPPLPVEFYPVLQMDPTVVNGCADWSGPTGAGTLAAGADGTICYLLGDRILEIDDPAAFSLATNGVTGYPEIEVAPPARTQAVLAEYTAAHIGEQMAMVVGGTVVSAPTIQSAINGPMTISAGDQQGAEELLERLKGR